MACPQRRARPSAARAVQLGKEWKPLRQSVKLGFSNVWGFGNELDQIASEGRCVFQCPMRPTHLERCHNGNKKSQECAESHVDGITGGLKGGKQMNGVDDAVGC